MNLLDEQWIPVCRANGEHDWISPFQISEPDIVALDARRPDFNGALIQFLIGLVQTTTPMDSETEWEEWNKKPPSMEELQEWFEPVRDAFVLDGDGARFMQDFELQTEKTPKKDQGWRKIGDLLIDIPTGKSLDDNTDHFVKRDSASGLCSSCLAAALYTLQTNAPEGGRGHYTSIRGGGPLTTIIMPEGKASLWKAIWLNVMPKIVFDSISGNSDFHSIEHKFPWMAPVELIQKSGAKTYQIQLHPAHMFWGMPRKIRIDTDSTTIGVCSICSRHANSLYSSFITKPNGYNYKGGWNHVLSPYRESKNQETRQMEWIAVHPQSGGTGYKDWLPYILGMNTSNRKIRPSTAISYCLENRIRGRGYRIFIYGYDMDSNKPCCWYESTLPLYGLTEKNIDGRNLLQREVARWIEAADHCAYLLRDAVKSAWFPRKPDGKLDTRGDFGFIDSQFWSVTEKQFYPLLRQLIDLVKDEEDESVPQAVPEQWRAALITATEKLFDVDLIGVAPIEQQNPHRIAEAFNRLRESLRGDKLKTLLNLPGQKLEKSRKKTAKRAA